MSGASRAKGLRGEREAADVFQANGWEMRGLESSGDWLAFYMREGWHLGDPGAAAFIAQTLHVEVKRQERLRLPEWLAQAKAEAPAGVPPVVVFRQSRGEWVACLPLTEFLGLIA
jgi:hypothetical protein